MKNQIIYSILCLLLVAVAVAGDQVIRLTDQNNVCVVCDHDDAAALAVAINVAHDYIITSPDLPTDHQLDQDVAIFDNTFILTKYQIPHSNYHSVELRINTNNLFRRARDGLSCPNYLQV
jgi:hypothetical protein